MTVPSPASPGTTTPTLPSSPSASSPVGPPSKRIPASVSCLGDLGVLGLREVDTVLASVLVSRSLLLSLSPDECDSDVDNTGLVVRARSSVVDVAVAALLVDASDVLCVCAGLFAFRLWFWDCVSERDVVDCWSSEGAVYDVWRKPTSPRSDTGLDGPDTITESVGVGALNGSTAGAGAVPAPPASVLEIPLYAGAETGRSGPRCASAMAESVGARATGRSMSNPCPRRLMRRAARLYHDVRTSSAQTCVELDEGEDVFVFVWSPEREWE